MTSRARALKGREEGRPGPITQLVRRLAGLDGGPSSGVVGAGDDLMAAVRRTITWRLTKELEKRNQWFASPRYLGLIGWESWWESDAGRIGTSALDELVVDVFSHLFVDKLPDLASRLRAPGNSGGVPNVDGLAVRLMCNFIHDRQQKNDRLGARVYRVLKAAVRRAIEHDLLEVQEGDSEVNASTLLAPVAGSKGSRITAEQLRHWVAQWNARLLPELVTGFGPQSKVLHAELRFCLAELAGELRSFLFGDLVRELVLDVRGRWADLYSSDGDEESEEGGEERPEFPWFRILAANDAITEADHLRKLLDCVTDCLGKLDHPPERLRHLQALWGFLLRFTADEIRERVPGGRKLGPALGIPRRHLTSLYATLGELVNQCRAVLAGEKPEDSEDG